MTRRRREGYSLIELFAAMILTTAAITLLGIWLVTAMRTQRTAGEHLLRMNIEDRLARQFRQDAHAAEAVLPLELNDPDLRLRLRMADREVRYLHMNRQVHRIEQSDNTIHRREQYQLSPVEVRFETSEGATPPSIAMLLGKRPLRIEATLGSDHRHERRAE